MCPFYAPKPNGNYPHSYYFRTHLEWPHAILLL
jgi:hypothetical protein